jgi:hypothetical protein
VNCETAVCYPSARESYPAMRRGVCEGSLIRNTSVCVKCWCDGPQPSQMVDTNRVVEVGVIDEIQLLADPDRGWAWTRALYGMPARELHVCGDPTALHVLRRTAEALGDRFKVQVRKHPRPLSQCACVEHPRTLLACQGNSWPHTSSSTDGIEVALLASQVVLPLRASEQPSRGRRSFARLGMPSVAVLCECKVFVWVFALMQ